MDIARTDIKQRKRRRQLLIGGGIAAFLVTAGIGLAALEPAAPAVERAGVWIDTVKRGEMLREVRGPGTLVPKEIRWIAADTNARVERLLIKPGVRVTPDSVIMELTNPELEDQLLASKSEVVAAEANLAARRTELESQLLDQKANLASVEADYEGARLQVEAEVDLTAKGIIPKVQHRRSQLNADRLKVRLDIEHERITKFGQNMRAQLAVEQARLKQLQSTAELRQRQVDALRLRAGIDGVLQQVPVEEGQQVVAGTNLARVARPDVLMAELRVAETQAKDIATGQKVSVDTRNGIVAGSVLRIDPAVQNGTVQVDVELSGELPAGARPDLSVDGTIEIERIADAVFVGRPAFGQANSDVQLFRIDPASGIAVRVPVRLGRSSVSVVEVVRGLVPGDQVVLSDTSAYDRYERIKLR